MVIFVGLRRVNAVVPIHELATTPDGKHVHLTGS
jgi:hypothetical protein